MTLRCFYWHIRPHNNRLRIDVHLPPNIFRPSSHFRLESLVENLIAVKTSDQRIKEITVGGGMVGADDKMCRRKWFCGLKYRIVYSLGGAKVIFQGQGTRFRPSIYICVCIYTYIISVHFIWHLLLQ